jgi:hypothetical protein
MAMIFIMRTSFCLSVLARLKVQTGQRRNIGFSDLEMVQGFGINWRICRKMSQSVGLLITNVRRDRRSASQLFRRVKPAGIDDASAFLCRFENGSLAT